MSTTLLDISIYIGEFLVLKENIFFDMTTRANNKYVLTVCHHLQGCVTIMQSYCLPEKILKSVTYFP